MNLHLVLEGRVSLLLTFHIFMAYGECVFLLCEVPKKGLKICQESVIKLGISLPQYVVKP